MITTLFWASSVLGQQLSDQGQRFHGTAVVLPPGDAGAGLGGGEVGDAHHLGWLGHQADQVLDRGLARDVEDRVAPAASGRTRSATRWQ